MLHDISTWTLADIVLARAAIVCLAAAIIPILATALGLTITRHRAVEDPALAKPDMEDPGFEAILEQFAAEGFEPVGAIFEESWLFHHHWYKGFQIHVLRSRDGMAYASIYRVIPNEPWRMALDSFTDRAAMIRTAMPGAGLEVRERDHWRREVPQRTPLDLIGEHAFHVKEHMGRYQSEVVKASLEMRAAIDERLERRQLKSTAGLQHLSWLVPALLIPSVMSFSALKVFAPEFSLPSRYAAAAIAGSIIYALVNVFVVPLIMKHAAAERNPA
jgi:hypothetical protein